MKSYKSYNIETGEPSDFSPLLRNLGMGFILFLVRPLLYSIILGLFGVTVGFWLAFAILFTGRTPFSVLIGTKLQKAFNNVAEAKALNQRYSTISYAVVQFVVSTMIGFLALRVLGVEVSILTVLAAQLTVDSMSHLLNRILPSIVKKSPNSTTPPDQGK
jgi:hypothetical protein